MDQQASLENHRCVALVTFIVILLIENDFDKNP